jgi:hypothetical protein
VSERQERERRERREIEKGEREREYSSRAMSVRVAF